MTKLVQNDLASLTNEQSALAALNANYASLETFSDTVLSRDGSTPNQMGSDFDMNSNRILNLPQPINADEPLRLQDLSDFIGGSLVIPQRADAEYHAVDFATLDMTGATDQSANLLTAFNAVDALGGGVIRIPAGVLGLSSEFAWGDGSNGAVSSKHNRIVLKGINKGIGFGAGQALASTVIRYIGAGTDDTKGVINIKGPLHSLGIEDLEIDAAGKLGYGLITNNVTDFLYKNVVVRRWRINSYLYTTRTGFPPSGPWGCGNGVVLNCYAYDVNSNTSGGIKVTSGVNPATSLVGNPSSANIDFIGGVYFYGGTTNSYGIHLAGADNNTFYGMQLLAQENTGGNSIFFEQWPGSTTWPLENIFTNLGKSQAVGGTSGTLGNTFVTFNTGDGAPIPTLANIRIMSVGGRSLMGNNAAATPTYSFLEDADTGIYRVGANSLGISAGGVTAASFDNVGNNTFTRSGGAPIVNIQRTDVHGPGVIIGNLQAQGRNTAAGFPTYANMYVSIQDDTSGSEDARWTWQTNIAGTLTDRAHVGNGFMVGTTTDPGAGTINVATEYRQNNTKVVGARVTGYTAFTGTNTNRATAYDTATITLVQLAERVRALQIDLTAHGLIGA